MNLLVDVQEASTVGLTLGGGYGSYMEFINGFCFR